MFCHQPFGLPQKSPGRHARLLLIAVLFSVALLLTSSTVFADTPAADDAASPSSSNQQSSDDDDSAAKSPPRTGDRPVRIQLIAWNQEASSGVSNEGSALIASTYRDLHGLPAAEGPPAGPMFVAPGFAPAPQPAAFVPAPEVVEESIADPAASGDEGLFATDGEYEYTRQWIPTGIIYRAYLAGEKESRFRSEWNYDENQGWIWDITLGGRVGLWRYGTSGDARPEGFQIDLEGAGIPRLDIEEDRDVAAVDFRAGIPFTFGTRTWQTKIAYYHLSSHLGDEFLLKNPGYPRLNYSRDVLVWGQSYYFNDDLRVYGEVGFSFYSDIAEPWEFQFGLDYSPGNATGRRGAPFAALNGALREEVDFSGNFVFQTGWAWRGTPSSGMFRMGFEYYTGKSDQFSLFNITEQKVGLGLWYDY